MFNLENLNPGTARTLPKYRMDHWVAVKTVLNSRRHIPGRFVTPGLWFESMEKKAPQQMLEEFDSRPSHQSEVRKREQ